MSDKEETKVVQKGTVMRPKESKFKQLYHIFFAMEPKDVVKSVFTTVVLPDIQYSLNNIWKRAGEIWFWGLDEKTSGSVRTGRKPRRDYSTQSSRNSRVAFQNESGNRGTRVNEFKEWGYDCPKSTIEKVVVGLEEDLNDYKAVTVGRLYELLAENMREFTLTPEPSHFDWGWVDGDEFDIEMGRDGLWHIIFPKLKRL